MPRRKHDVFISHAWEDKDEIARPLAEELQRRGFDVWYDDYALKVGDHLRESIDMGLANSRFGVVILSPHFFAKEWPQYELDGLVSEEKGRKQKMILPVWHKVTQADVRKFSPTLALTIAARSSDGLTRVADQISEAIPERRRRSRQEASTEQTESAARTIEDFHITSLGRDEITVEWRTSATVELHVSVFRAGSKTPEHAIHRQSLSMVQQAFTFHDLKPGASYLVVAESGDDRQRLGFKTLEGWMR